MQLDENAANAVTAAVMGPILKTVRHGILAKMWSLKESSNRDLAMLTCGYLHAALEIQAVGLDEFEILNGILGKIAIGYDASGLFNIRRAEYVDKFPGLMDLIP